MLLESGYKAESERKEGRQRRRKMDVKNTGGKRPSESHGHEQGHVHDLIIMVHLMIALGVHRLEQRQCAVPSASAGRSHHLTGSLISRALDGGRSPRANRCQPVPLLFNTPVTCRLVTWGTCPCLIRHTASCDSVQALIRNEAPRASAQVFASALDARRHASAPLLVRQILAA